MGLKNIVLAELKAQLWWLRNNRWLLVLQFLWPYMAVVILYVIGTSYGSMERLKESLGITDPILYLFAASNIAFTASGLIDSVAGIATWHRWIGTLPYVYLQPNKFPTYLVISGLANSLYNVVLNYLALLPGVLIYTGIRGGLGLTVVLLILIIGALPLVGIAILAAFLSLLAREEGNIISFLNPLLLFLSGVFYPVTLLPWILRVLSSAVPVTYVVEAAKMTATLSEGPGRALFYAAYTIGILAVLYNITSIAVIGSGEGYARKTGVIE